MRAFAPLLTVLAVAALPGASGGQEAEAPPSGVERAAREEIAARWDVRPEALVLEWGELPASLVGSVARAPAVELLGSGAGGHWVVRTASGDGAPASFRVRAGRRALVSAAARDVARGDVLTAGDVTEVEEVVWGAGDAGRVAASPVGWVAHRPVARGERLRAPAVRPPLLVVSGRPVEIVWARGGLRLTVPGVAGASAALGDTVFVRSVSGERIRGVVAAAGVVDVSREGVR